MSEDAAERGRETHQDAAEHQSRQARLNARIADIPVLSGVTGTTLYQAIDAYADSVTQNNPKESGKVEAANTQRLKNTINDMDFTDFGYMAMDRLKNYWANRPDPRRGIATASHRANRSASPPSITTSPPQDSSSAGWIEQTPMNG